LWTIHTTPIRSHWMRLNTDQKSPYYNFYGWNPDGTYKYLYTWTDFPFINFDLQRNRDYLLDVAKFWLENYNIDGFRCDAAAEVNDQHPGGSTFGSSLEVRLKRLSRIYSCWES